MLSIGRGWKRFDRDSQENIISDAVEPQTFDVRRHRKWRYDLQRILESRSGNVRSFSAKKSDEGNFFSSLALAVIWPHTPPLLASFSDNGLRLATGLRQPCSPIQARLVYPCPTCSRVFERRTSLNRHLSYACGQHPRFKCLYCRYQCNFRSNVYSHVRVCHKGREVVALDVMSCCVKKPRWCARRAKPSAWNSSSA